MVRHFKLLSNPNYGRYFTGLTLSMTGTWMQSMVQSWLVYRLSNSSTWLGAITFCMQVPAFLLSPFAGAIADQYDRRKILIATQIAGMLQAFVFSILVYFDLIELWQIAALSVFLGISNAFEMTTRHSFAVDIAGKAELPSAIALNSLSMNGSRVLGPAIGGVLIAAIHEAGCFFLNGLSYFASLTALITLKLPRPVQTEVQRGSPLARIREGLRYVRETPEINSLLAISALITLVGTPYMVLLPVITKDTLHGGASTLAWLSAANGLGAILGGLTATAVRERIKRHLALRLLLLGIMIGLLAITTRIPIAAAVLCATGFLLMSTWPMMNIAIQNAVRDSMRGRVLSLYTMAFLGTMPIAGVLSGLMADHAGPKLTLLTSAGLCVLTGGHLLRGRVGHVVQP